ncbi:GNAT family N-acetyltransferase [Negadavirga shengliensis]|uniref:GNAT family N-acetyltransferase n=1 Tax=Negadavirga shengliensis TaxID=1389218 RepID=A0ABV9SZN0_9BACT
MTIETNQKPALDELMVLFSQVSWAKSRSRERVQQMLENDPISVCIRLEGKLVAYGRILTDGCFRGLLDDIIVDEPVRGKGYGAILVRELLKLADDVDVLFLNADPDMEDFYLRFGFKKFGLLTMIRPKEVPG